MMSQRQSHMARNSGHVRGLQFRIQRVSGIFLTNIENTLFMYFFLLFSTRIS